MENLFIFTKPLTPEEKKNEKNYKQAIKNILKNISSIKLANFKSANLQNNLQEIQDDKYYQDIEKIGFILLEFSKYINDNQASKLKYNNDDQY